MKILILRFSSIGDIVLTSPVMRCIKKQRPDIEIHYATKEQFQILLQDNPYIDKLHTLKDRLAQLIGELKEEGFDIVLDLHNNQRTFLIKKRLGIKQTFSFRKLNIEKWLMVHLKMNRLPALHIVDRYMEPATKALGIYNDKMGLDYFIPAKDEIDIKTSFPDLPHSAYIALVIGAKHNTKKLPDKHLLTLCEWINKPVILLGGKAERKNADWIIRRSEKKIWDACGKLNLNQSASIIRQAEKVIAPDTGLMHIAAAFKKDLCSVWGNTIPELGMYPYYPEPENSLADDEKTKQNNILIEVKNLACRPCSKLGYPACPKKHFYCMEMTDLDAIADWANV